MLITVVPIPNQGPFAFTDQVTGSSFSTSSGALLVSERIAFALAQTGRWTPIPPPGLWTSLALAPQPWWAIMSSGGSLPASLAAPAVNLAAQLSSGPSQQRPTAAQSGSPWNDSTLGKTIFAHTLLGSLSVLSWTDANGNPS